MSVIPLSGVKVTLTIQGRANWCETLEMFKCPNTRFVRVLGPKKGVPLLSRPKLFDPYPIERGVSSTPYEFTSSCPNKLFTRELNGWSFFGALFFLLVPVFFLWVAGVG